jgi:DNA-binding NtrC family response regulator
VTVQCASAGESGTMNQATFASASGGTLLLDEIGDLAPDEQKMLLGLLEKSDGAFRVVASTYRALPGLVERGAFDHNLYKRIAGELVEVPPLRSRPDDIMPMASRFAEEFGASVPVRMSAGAVARLRSYPWPGNVLELRNAMERAVRLANGGEMLAEHLPSETLAAPSGEGRLREHVDSVERDAIVKALADSNHNQTHAAKRLGISRRALIYKMEKYSLKPPPGARR